MQCFIFNNMTEAYSDTVAESYIFRLTATRNVLNKWEITMSKYYCISLPCHLVNISHQLSAKGCW